MNLRPYLLGFLIAIVLAAGLPVAPADGAAASGEKGVLGVAVTNPSPPWHGALIARVVPEGAAAHAGLQPQDLIVQADSQSITSASDLTAFVATHRAGDHIAFTVLRFNGGSSPGRVALTATLALAAPPQGTSDVASSAQNSPAPTAVYAPAPPAAAAPAHGLTDVSWTTFTDPYEGAFTIDVPRGWKVAGGVVRKIPLIPNLVLRVLSPDRRTLIALGDPDSAPYNAPTAARDYVQRFTERAMSGACSGLKIVDVHDLPDVEQYARANSIGTYNQWSAAQTEFTCSGERQTGMSGEAIAVLQYMTTLRSGHAQVLAGFVTTTGQGEQADQLLNHIVQSLHQDPQWSERQQRLAQQLAAGAMARWRGEQRQFQQMDDAITNTGHFVAPDGRRYDLDSRPRYQWRTPDGHTMGTDTPTPPVPGATQLERQPE
jgi:PDZ domain